MNNRAVTVCWIGLLARCEADSYFARGKREQFEVWDRYSLNMIKRGYELAGAKTADDRLKVYTLALSRAFGGKFK